MVVTSRRRYGNVSRNVAVVAAATVRRPYTVILTGYGHESLLRVFQLLPVSELLALHLHMV